MGRGLEERERPFLSCPLLLAPTPPAWIVAQLAPTQVELLEAARRAYWSHAYDAPPASQTDHTALRLVLSKGYRFDPTHIPGGDAMYGRDVEEPGILLASRPKPTSVRAGLADLPASGTQRRRVLDAIVDATRRGHGGATDPEIQRHLQMGPNTERPRRVELVARLYVVDSGATRDHEGRAHIVWRATPLALQAVGGGG